jgi:quinoprotein glucose dehydrogenase
MSSSGRSDCRLLIFIRQNFWLFTKLACIRRSPFSLYSAIAQTYTSLKMNIGRSLVLALALVFPPLHAVSASHRGAANSDTGWPVYGGNLAGQRYSGLTQINRSNIDQLRVAWSFQTHALDGPPSPLYKRAPFEATPVLWNDTLYFDSPFDTIFALDASTGHLKWSFDPKVDRNGEIYIVTSRGVALWHAKNPRRGTCGSDVVLVATLDRRLIARDARTGAACPRFGNDGTVDLSQGVSIGKLHLYSFTSPPTVVGDTIVLGSSVGDNQLLFAASGAVRGFDAVTGRQKWSWEPVRWTATQHPRLSGSGNAWSIISADPENDMVFVPTGSPSVDFYGGKRPGDNRDADSLVALRASTGQKVWTFQLVHHDLWDYDTPSEPLLFTFRGSIPAVAITTKTDMIYVFNRLTGEPLYPVVERPVAASTIPDEHAWPTQPFSSLPPLGPLSFTSADIHLHNAADQRFCRNWIDRLDNKGLFTPPSVHGSLISPGNGGGANWGSSAFDPTSAIMYTHVSMLPFIVRLIPQSTPEETLFQKIERHIYKDLPEWAGGDPPPIESEFEPPDHGGNYGRDIDPQVGAPFMVARQALMSRDGTPCGPTPFGSIVATDLNTGRRVWSVADGQMAEGEQGGLSMSGPVATAGGLLFVSSLSDATLRAYDSKTGREVWYSKLPGPGDATPMTFSSHGRQFIAVAENGDGTKGNGQALIVFALPK